MNGTIRENIRPGTKVRVVQKQDQRSGKLTEVWLKSFLQSQLFILVVLKLCLRVVLLVELRKY